VIALLGHQQNQMCMQPPAVGSIASTGFLEQINSPSGYHRDGEILHVIKLVGLQARSGVLVQSELGAAALRNLITILIPQVKKALWGEGREFMLYGRPESSVLFPIKKGAHRSL